MIMKKPTISKAAQAIHRGHFDDKSKDVINESVETLVRHHTPRQVSYGLQFVVDEQLRSHHYKTCLTEQNT